MGNKEIALSDIKQRLADQIKGQFAAMIPDEEWEALIERETNEFMKVQFPKLVQEELTTKLKEVILKEFNGPRWADHWNGYYNAPGEAVTKLIREHSDVIVETLVGGMVNSAVQQMRNNLQGF